MWVLRAVRIDDLDALHELVKSATRGLTSLQLKRDQLLDRIEHSEFAFSRSGPSPRGEPYVLVLVNQQTGELAGTSTVYAKTGGYQPFYAYQLVETEHVSEQLGVRQRRQSLLLTRIHDGPTEIGSLFLRGKYRGHGFGRWLSMARFALIAMRPHRFADRVIAEMRGRADKDGTVPFFEAIAGKFIPIEFAIADALSTVSKQFIEELMPDSPIYLDLLPSKIRDGIGQVHDETVPALAMLKKEGFRETAFVDIFDGGPMISCETQQINAVKRTRELSVKSILVDQPSGSETGGSETGGSEKHIVCSTHHGFTSVYTTIVIAPSGDEVAIDAASAEALQVGIGSTCYVLGKS